MGRPTTISDPQILDAARAVFLERGIAATTAEVARKAGVAEGSIFKRWPTKQALFYAALTPDTEEPAWLQTLALRAGRGDMVATLTDVAMEAIGFFRTLLPLFMMCWSNPSSTGLATPLDIPNSKPVRILKKLAGYFEAEMSAGRMARRDAEVVARTFIGAIQNFAFLELLDRNHEELPLPAEMFVRSLVHLLWHGVAPEVTSKKSPIKKPRKERVR
ncbi:MAG: helix-turn-helix domain-containing protein [Polyangia bacterium]